MTLARLTRLARLTPLFVLATLVARAPAARAAAKLIHHGWDIPSPAYAREHVHRMEELPFDGTTIRMRYGRGQVFGRERWSEATMAPEIEALAATRWTRFTENFLMVYAASEIDWASDADWAIAIANVTLLARAAQHGGLRGLCFDPEPYGKSPWTWAPQPGPDRIEFADYQDLVRRRGAEFLRAILKEMPRARILTFFAWSGLYDAADRPPELAIPGCGGAGDRRLETHPYGLYPAFLAGLLDAAKGSTVILDGNELAYYYTSPAEFSRARHAIKTDSRCLLPRGLERIFAANVKVAPGVYVDEVLGRRDKTRPTSQLSPSEQLQWLEQNVYSALRESDGYAWLYSESMDWWERKNLPDGALEAIDSARTKLARKTPLGFDLGDRLAVAKRAVGR